MFEHTTSSKETRCAFVHLELMNAIELERIARARRLCRDGSLRTLRASAGLSLRELAAAVGVSHVCVLNWERRTTSPTPTNALALLDLVEQLLSGASR